MCSFSVHLTALELTKNMTRMTVKTDEFKGKVFSGDNRKIAVINPLWL